jgi:multiple sugar transport system permease protein
MATTHVDIGARYPAETYHGRYSPEATWGVIMVIPFLVVFVAFVLWPVLYGLWLGRNPATYQKLFADPIYRRTLINTAIFLGVGINLKLFLALLLSAYFASTKPWIRWLSVIFILPWAVPSIPTILSFRWMLNSEWGMLNNLLIQFGWDNPPWWLVKPNYAFGSAIAVHIWKYLPFWTLILLAGRMAIPHDYYEAAKVDGRSCAIFILPVLCSRPFGAWAILTASTSSPAAVRASKPMCWRPWASAMLSSSPKSTSASPPS